MRASVCLAWLTVGLGSAFLPPGAAAPAQPSADPARTDPRPAEVLTGGAAWAALLGNTVTGTTPDGPYTEYFAADGSVIHLDREGRDVGRWTLNDPLVCFSYPNDLDAAECRRPEVDGSHGAFVDVDGSRYPFDITAGNAKHL